ncbi:MAG: N-acetyltransferase [Nitrospirales bacterium]|nr:MAG: N-acetyltransferase [Nitrospirales bacterium]
MAESMNTPFLVGKTVYLRALTEEDISGNWKNWFNDSEVCRFNTHFRFPNSEKKMHDYLESLSKAFNELVLAIIMREGDEHVGNISLQRIDWINRSAELAMVLGEKKYWGKGIGFESAQLVVRHGLEELNLNRISCGTSVENLAMQKIAIKLGMKEEGRRRKVLYRAGKYHDYFDYALVREE